MTEGQSSVSEQPKAWLSDLDWQLGKLMRVAAPTLWLRLSRRVHLPGFDGDGHFVRASIIHDVCRNCMIPRIQAVRQVADSTRIIADADVLADQFRVMIGQQVPLLDVSGKAGFKKLKFSPEVRLGVDVRALAPTIDVLLSDDDYSGYAINPISHPLALLGAVGTYTAMMKYRFPISATVKVAKFKLQNRDVDVQLSTLTRRVEDNKVTTTKFTGAMLTINV
eukprot:jgi/Ulvmu1/11390/UM075_0052.1